jgi:ATP-binding cassette subfamily F protein uup
LGKLGITKTEQLISSLSGGQKKRVALCKVLYDKPDLVIMDEPTNHLDIEMIEWLEGYLSSQNLSCLVVTHDRYFLDNVCNRILEIENGSLYPYAGNFSYYLEKKAERDAQQQSELEKARNLYKRELEWVRRQPKARTTKSKSRVDAF